ncbi:hypothetical protein JOM56_001225 [Amanita muscaria]
MVACVTFLPFWSKFIVLSDTAAFERMFPNGYENAIQVGRKPKPGEEVKFSQLRDDVVIRVWGGGLESLDRYCFDFVNSQGQYIPTPDDVKIYNVATVFQPSVQILSMEQNLENACFSVLRRRTTRIVFSAYPCESLMTPLLFSSDVESFCCHWALEPTFSLDKAMRPPNSGFSFFFSTTFLATACDVLQVHSSSMLKMTSVQITEKSFAPLKDALILLFLLAVTDAHERANLAMVNSESVSYITFDHEHNQEG